MRSASALKRMLRNNTRFYMDGAVSMILPLWAVDRTKIPSSSRAELFSLQQNIVVHTRPSGRRSDEMFRPGKSSAFSTRWQTTTR